MRITVEKAGKESTTTCITLSENGKMVGFFSVDNGKVLAHAFPDRRRSRIG